MVSPLTAARPRPCKVAIFHLVERDQGQTLNGGGDRFFALQGLTGLFGIVDLDERVDQRVFEGAIDRAFGCGPTGRGRNSSHLFVPSL